MRCRLIFDFVSGKEGRSEINIGSRLLVTKKIGREDERGRVPESYLALLIAILPGKQADTYRH